MRTDAARDLARHYATTPSYDRGELIKAARGMSAEERRLIVAIAPDRVLDDLIRAGLIQAGPRPNPESLRRTAAAELTKNESKNYGLIYEFIEKNNLRPLIDAVRAGRPGEVSGGLEKMFRGLSAGERQALLAALKNEKFLSKAPSPEELIALIRNPGAAAAGDSGKVRKPRVFVQPREAQFGRGENNRCYELPYRGVALGVNLGDVSKSPTTAVMCPTTPFLQIGGGAIENVLAEAGGKDFERNLERARKSVPGEKIPYGAALAMPSSGELAKSGIKQIILSAVTPSGDHGGMKQEDMVEFTYNACIAAHKAGLDSITVPAVGTGFAAAFGFGMSREDSMSGFVQGFKKFVDEVGGADKTPLKRIDYNIYARPSMESATSLANFLDELGVPRQLKE